VFLKAILTDTLASIRHTNHKRKWCHGIAGPPECIASALKLAVKPIFDIAGSNIFIVSI
jgi:hypothetical protein